MNKNTMLLFEIGEKYKFKLKDYDTGRESVYSGEILSVDPIVKRLIIRDIKGFKIIISFKDIKRATQYKEEVFKEILENEQRKQSPK